MSRRKYPRRDFLAETAYLSGIFGALTTGINIIGAKDAEADTCAVGGNPSEAPHRKYLIAIECSGGQDQWYLGHGIDPSQFAGTNYADRYSRHQGFSDQLGGSARKPVANTAIPGSPGHFLGPCLGAVSDYDNGGLFRTQDLLDRFCIVKGIQKEGEHTLGNQIVANGGNSVYNAGHCSVIADACSRIKNKPFQHVALGNFGYNQVGNLQGNAVPTLVSSLEAFQNSVQDLSGDPTRLNRKHFVKQMVSELYSSVATQGFLLCESKQLFADFGKFFDKVMGMRETPLLNSDPANRWDEIFAWWNGFVNFQRENFSMAQYCFDPNNGPPSGRGIFYNANAGSFAFYGALTEFLIRRDLASVITFKYDSDDRHGVKAAHNGGLIGEGNLQAAFGVLFTGLMYRLKKVSIGGGKTLLDQTLLTTYSEFDRTEFDDGAGGSDHGRGHTLLMAGGPNSGVKGGVVTGRSGLYPGARGIGGVTDAFSNLRMNPDGTPNLDNSGLALSSSYIMPIILRMMGANLPPQQITEASNNVNTMTWIKPIVA